MDKGSIKTPIVKKYGYKVELDFRILHSYREDKEWGEWEEDRSWWFESIRPCKDEDHYPDIVSDFEIKPGEKGYLVWYTWDTGDSFGHGNNMCAECMGLFKDIDSAANLKCAIELAEPNDEKSNYEFNHTTPDGQEFHEGFASWFGYFESLGEVHIETITMGPYSNG